MKIIFLDIDDDPEMLPEQMKHFVKVDFEDGFSSRHYDKAFSILQMS